MLNFNLKSIKNIIKLINRVASSDDLNVIKANEQQIFLTLITPIIFSMILVNLILCYIWNVSLIMSSILFVVYFTSGFTAYFIKSKKLKPIHTITINIINTLITLSATYLVYYGYVGTHFYINIILLSFTNALSVNRIYLLFTYSLYPIYFALSFILFPNSYLQNDLGFTLVLVFCYFLVVSLSYTLNSIYRHILMKKNKYLMSLKTQNDRIKNTQYNLMEIAYKDDLTGLPNRKMIREHMERIIKNSFITNESFAVVFIDLDDFKKINDTMGHSVGDQVLIIIAKLLTNYIDSEDIIGRLGGDELALIINRPLDQKALDEYLNKMSLIITQPFHIENKEIRTSASIGLALYPQDAITIENLFKAADIAMYKAKDSGKNMVQFYNKELNFEVSHKIKMENHLIYAIKRNEISMEYQPLFNTTSHQIVGFEALARWFHPSFGEVNPECFIELAEEIGFIDRLGDWIIYTSCQKLLELEELFDRELYMSINISTSQMSDRYFVERVTQIIDELSIQPCKIQFEITESLFMSDFETASKTMNQLKTLGITFALDDFGTGFSSLSYLVNLPIDTLKIDKSFIDKINTNLHTQKIVENLIIMVHSLDMKVIAEGVEQMNQMEFLKMNRCDTIQGYLLGRPYNSQQLLHLPELLSYIELV